jgi:hypothetical protein
MSLEKVGRLKKSTAIPTTKEGDTIVFRPESKLSLRLVCNRLLILLTRESIVVERSRPLKQQDVNRQLIQKKNSLIQLRNTMNTLGIIK